jgi:hypothetical protein
MPKLYNDSVRDASEKIQWQRDDVAAKIIDFEQAREKQSQRQFAIEQGVSRSTLQHWLARKNCIDASASLIDFFESPVGTAFLHRIVTAAHFAFTKDGVASIHNVSSFLKLRACCLLWLHRTLLSKEFPNKWMSPLLTLRSLYDRGCHKTWLLRK